MQTVTRIPEVGCFRCQPILSTLIEAHRAKEGKSGYWPHGIYLSVVYTCDACGAYQTITLTASVHTCDDCGTTVLTTSDGDEVIIVTANVPNPAAYRLLLRQ